MPNEFESLKTVDIFENLYKFLEELKPLKMKKETSLSPLTLGFFKYWGNCIKIGKEVFEVQCEKDLNDNWKKYVDDSKIPDCLRYSLTITPPTQIETFSLFLRIVSIEQNQILFK